MVAHKTIRIKIPLNRALAIALGSGVFAGYLFDRKSAILVLQKQGGLSSPEAQMDEILFLHVNETQTGGARPGDADLGGMISALVAEDQLSVGKQRRLQCFTGDARFGAGEDGSALCSLCSGAGRK